MQMNFDGVERPAERLPAALEWMSECLVLCIPIFDLGCWFYRVQGQQLQQVASFDDAVIVQLDKSTAVRLKQEWCGKQSQ